MYKAKMQRVHASDIADYLNADLHGEDVLLIGPSAVRTQHVDQMLRSAGGGPEPWLLITAEANPLPAPGSYVVTPYPDRDQALVIREFFASPTPVAVHPTACVAPDAVLGRNVRVGAHSVIDSGVEIGDFVWIMNNVVIHGPAKIGKGTVIKDGAVIGSEGYGFVEDENGQLFHPPQLGRVLIGENVWVGANSTIERAMILDTVIQDSVKIDDLVHIGNGSCIGRKSMITAGCVIAYDVRIGEDVTLAPNVSVRESCCIASGVLVGQGGVVIQDISKPGTYVGVPAEKLETSK
jgi:UDP-3-O-[3-hydroxymyristoyl] glucosamine N-acyltransferase